MAFLSATSLKGATAAAILMVVVIVSSMGEPAAAGTSCSYHRCISECPSKCQAEADNTCGYMKHGGSRHCSSGCFDGCTSSCRGACSNGGSAHCPSGRIEDCDSYCRTYCDDNYCSGQEQPEYRPCLSAVSERCKNDCEAACKGGN